MLRRCLRHPRLVARSLADPMRSLGATVAHLAENSLMVRRPRVADVAHRHNWAMMTMRRCTMTRKVCESAVMNEETDGGPSYARSWEMAQRVI